MPHSSQSGAALRTTYASLIHSLVQLRRRESNHTLCAVGGLALPPSRTQEPPQGSSCPLQPPLTFQCERQQEKTVYQHGRQQQPLSHSPSSAISATHLKHSSCHSPSPRHIGTALERPTLTHCAAAASSSDPRTLHSFASPLHPPSIFSRAPKRRACVPSWAASSQCASMSHHHHPREASQDENVTEWEGGGTGHLKNTLRHLPQDGHGQSERKRQQPSAPFAHLTDMRHPSTWFPGARAMQRRIIAHLGPTNSGKTHAALESLKAAQGGGVYCGPLRLLACEISERLLSAGVACKLVTGQEVREVEGAKHVAATVEMAPLMPSAAANRGVNAFEVGVLDEVQMMADPGRGWGWTRVLLGMQAQTLHVCGDPGALPLLKQLAEECGDILEVRQYTRLAPLVVCGEPLGSLSSLQPGDCLVAFSRKKVHALQREVGRRSSHRAAMVYGALPPGARSQQAARFNQQQEQQQQQQRQEEWSGELRLEEVLLGREGMFADEESGGEDDEGCHVLVASDAIGMGLNLSIRRVIFTTLSKFDGKSKRQLNASEIRQIAGRAGRYKPSQPPPSSSAAAAALPHVDMPQPGTELDAAVVDVQHQQQKQEGGEEALQPQQGQAQLGSGSGYVTVLDGRDLWALHCALAEPHAELKQACLMPRLDDLALFFAALNSAEQGRNGEAPRFDTALLRYIDQARLSPQYFCVNVAPMVAIASLLSCYSPPYGGLSVTELLTFCTAPADVSVKSVASALLRFTTLYLEDGVVPVGAAATRTLASSALSSVMDPESSSPDPASLLASSYSSSHSSSRGVGFEGEEAPWDWERVSGWRGSMDEKVGRRGREGASAKRRQRIQHQQHARMQSSAEVQLRSLEEQHSVLDLYVWLAYRMPHAFVDLDAAIAARTELGTEIERTLDTLAFVRNAAFEGEVDNRSNNSTEGKHGNADAMVQANKSCGWSGRADVDRDAQGSVTCNRAADRDRNLSRGSGNSKNQSRESIESCDANVHVRASRYVGAANRRTSRGSSWKGDQHLARQEKWRRWGWEDDVESRCRHAAKESLL